MFYSNKYLKNFGRHRRRLLLQQKINFSKTIIDKKNTIFFQNYSELFENNLIKKTKSVKKNDLSIIEFNKTEQNNFQNFKTNTHKINDQSIKLSNLNKKNYFYVIDFLSKLFRYSYLFRFILDFGIILFFINYFFTNVTLF